MLQGMHYAELDGHGVYANATSQDLDTLHQLMDAADVTPPGQTKVHGRYWNSKDQTWIKLPYGSDDDQMLTLASGIASKHFDFQRIDGVRMGSSVAQIPTQPLCKAGILVTWLRRDRLSSSGA